MLRLTVKDLAGNVSFGVTEVAGEIKTVSYNPPPVAVSTGVNAPRPASTGAAAEPYCDSRLADCFRRRREAIQPPTTSTWAPTLNTVAEPQERLVATSQTPVAPPPAAAVPSHSPVPASPAPKPMPTVKYVNRPQVMLAYELDKVGSSGVGSIDLWWTQNDGQSWELYAVAPDVKGSKENGRHQREVELPGEGVYGFILVVKSRAGLGKSPPHAGDMPQVRVEVDTMRPTAKLWAPVIDPQHPGCLLLKYEAKDKNMADNPITLEWAESLNGPWKAIVTDAKNDGHYSWQPTPSIPVQVYMRLRVRDVADNEGIAVTQEAQWVDLSEPEGRLIDVTTTSKAP